MPVPPAPSLAFSDALTLDGDVKATSGCEEGFESGCAFRGRGGRGRWAGYWVDGRSAWYMVKEVSLYRVQPNARHCTNYGGDRVVLAFVVLVMSDVAPPSPGLGARATWTPFRPLFRCRGSKPCRRHRPESACHRSEHDCAHARGFCARPSTRPSALTSLRCPWWAPGVCGVRPMAWSVGFVVNCTYRR